MKGKMRSSLSRLRWRKVFLGVVVVVALVAMVGGFLAYLEARRAKEARKFRQEAKRIWQRVLADSAKLESTINETLTKDDLKSLSKTLSKTEDYVIEELYEAASLSPSDKHLSSKRKLIKALDDYSDYLATAQRVTLRFSKGKGKKNDIKKLKSKAWEARKSCQQFVKETRFIKGNISERVFSVALRLQLIAEKSRLKSGLSLMEEAEERGRAVVKARREKEAKRVRDVARRWLDGELAGGTETNWELASTRFRQQILSTFPPGQQTKQSYLQLFQEGEAHFRLISYEIVEVFILSYDEALVSLVAVRQKIDGTKTPPEQEELPLVSENGQWLVDDVGF